MKASELREKTVEGLQEQLHDLLKEQFNLRMQRASGQLEKPHQLQEVRRNIARVKTVMNQKAGE